MRAQVAFYASTPAYRPVLDVHGWGDLQPELHACSKRGEDTAHLIDDEMLDTFVIIATPEALAGEWCRGWRIADRINVAWCGRTGGRPSRPPFGRRDDVHVTSPRASSGWLMCWPRVPASSSLSANGRPTSKWWSAFAAYVDGECVVDVWAGESAPASPGVATPSPSSCPRPKG